MASSAFSCRKTDLPGALDRALRTPRPDPQALAEQVRARFGVAAFAANVGRVVDRLWPWNRIACKCGSVGFENTGNEQ